MNSKTPTGGSEPDLEGLRDFAETPDRELSPIFVGRKDELARFDRLARRTLDDWRNGRPVAGSTTVVTGCPGMGKSSLLRRFVETRCNRKGDPESPFATVIDHDDLRDRETLSRKFHEAAKTHPAWSELVGAVFTTAGDWLKAASLVEAVKRQTPDFLSRMRPVCLVVDEIQNVGPGNGRALSTLHTGTLDLPILPLYAGLNDSIDALRAAGISRLARNAVVPLELLSREETREAVETLFDNHRVTGPDDERKRWIEAVATDSAGFPQHLHVGLQETASVVAERSGVLDSEGLAEVRRRAAEARKGYYRSRLSPTVADHPETLLTLVRMASGNGPPAMRTRHRVVDAALEHMRTLTDRYDMPTREDARGFVNAMIHDGILQEDGNGGCKVPIPSMTTWLLKDYAQEAGIASPPRPNRKTRQRGR